ncbi:MAG: CGNR zinc finger domain-containing protein [Marmoricola sp.]
MDFADDTRSALRAAVALVNSATEPDTLDAVAALDAFFLEHAYTGRHDRTRAELEEVRALRSPRPALLLADRDDAVARLNRMLREAGAIPQLVRHDALDWHVHAVGPQTPLATRIAVETAMAMIDVVRADEMSRLAVCADADCGGVVLDLSRNRSRRYCSVTCSNRAAVAAYRARRR